MIGEDSPGDRFGLILRCRRRGCHDRRHAAVLTAWRLEGVSYPGGAVKQARYKLPSNCGRPLRS